MVAELEQRVKPNILTDAEVELPNLLERRNEWTGIILYTSLQVRRVYRSWRNGFLFLQELEESPERKADFHTHPGEMWVALREGSYQMDVAYERKEGPKEGEYETRIIKASDKYYMGPNDWHRIHPLTERTRSVVVVQNWSPPAISNIQVDQMTARELQYHLDMFRAYS